VPRRKRNLVDSLSHPAAENLDEVTDYGLA